MATPGGPASGRTRWGRSAPSAASGGGASVPAQARPRRGGADQPAAPSPPAAVPKRRRYAPSTTRAPEPAPQQPTSGVERARAVLRRGPAARTPGESADVRSARPASSDARTARTGRTAAPRAPRDEPAPAPEPTAARRPFGGGVSRGTDPGRPPQEPAGGPPPRQDIGGGSRVQYSAVDVAMLLPAALAAYWGAVLLKTCATQAGDKAAVALWLMVAFLGVLVTMRRPWARMLRWGWVVAGLIAAASIPVGGG